MARVTLDIQACWEAMPPDIRRLTEILILCGENAGGPSGVRGR